jgi:uncharacterized protein
MKSIEWVVKASKFCNLRCEYCYEWNSLGDLDRISLKDWRRLLDGIRSYHFRLQRRLGEPVEVRLIWHGGEPLALPSPYLDAAMSLQREVLDGLRHTILLQTNLYRVPESTLDVLLRHRVKLGVSMDVFGGVRRDLRGRETEDAVVANMDRLDRRGIRFGAITVVAKHNHRRLRDVHDFWVRRRMGFRVLPLFDGPPERPPGRFELSEAELVAALSGLFEHWIEAGAVVDIAPLSEWLGDVIRKLLGARRRVYDRRRDGERVFLVETNGDLYQTDERGRPELSLGNVVTDPMDRILAGDAFAASLARTDAKTAIYCGGCPHYGFCDGYPVHAEPFTTARERGCPVTTAVHDHMERYLVGAGYSATTLMHLLADDRRRTS